MGNKIKWMNIKKAIKLKANMQARGNYWKLMGTSQDTPLQSKQTFWSLWWLWVRDKEGDSWEQNISQKHTSVPKSFSLVLKAACNICQILHV